MSTSRSVDEKYNLKLHHKFGYIVAAVNAYNEQTSALGIFTLLTVAVLECVRIYAIVFLSVRCSFRDDITAESTLDSNRPINSDVHMTH